MAWLAYEKQAQETGFDIQTLFDGFNDLKAIVKWNRGQCLQPPLASDLKVLMSMMINNQEKCLTAMEGWTSSLGGRFTVAPLKKAERMVVKVSGGH